MPYLDSIRDFVQGLIDECQDVEKINQMTNIINDITDKENGYNNLLNEYKKLLKNHETTTAENDYTGLSFDEMLKEFSKK